MRKIGLVLLAAGGLAIFGALPAKAVGTRHAFCIQGDDIPALSDCSFDSYGQCMATASGRFLSCVANPYFAGAGRAPYTYAHRGRRYQPGPYESGYYPGPYEEGAYLPWPGAAGYRHQDD
jgi:hypothetical protein